MCRAGGRRCPGQYDPAKAAARNAQRRANYAAKKSGNVAGGGVDNGAANALKSNGASPEQTKKSLNAALKNMDETFYHSGNHSDTERMDAINKVMEQNAAAKASGGDGISDDQVKIMAERANNVLEDMDTEVKESGSWAEYKADEAEDAKLHPRATKESIAQAELEAKLARESSEKEAKRAAEARAMVEKHFPGHLENTAAARLGRAQEKLNTEQANLNEAQSRAEKSEDPAMASAITRNPANRVKDAEKKVAQAEARLKDLQDTTKRRLDQVAVTGYPGQAKEMRAEIKPAIDAEKAKVKEAKEALLMAREEEEAAKENLIESAEWVKQAKDDEYYHGLNPNATAASLESARKMRESAEQNYQEAVERDKVAEAELEKLTAKKNYISGEEVKMTAYESSSAGFTYKNPVPAPEEMRRSVPAGVSFQEAVAPGDYVRHLGEYVKVDSYAVTERGITVNEGEDTETFIPINDWHDGGVLLRSRPGTNDGEDYNEDDHFDEPELRRVGDGSRGSNGYDEDYDDLYGYEDDGFPEDDVDFSDDLDPADLGDPYGDRDYGDDY